MCPGLILHLKGHYFRYKFNLFIISQHYYLSFYLEHQFIPIAGTFDPSSVIWRILVVLVLRGFTCEAFKILTPFSAFYYGDVSLIKLMTAI